MSDGLFPDFRFCCGLSYPNFQGLSADPRQFTDGFKGLVWNSFMFGLKVKDSHLRGKSRLASLLSQYYDYSR